MMKSKSPRLKFPSDGTRAARRRAARRAQQTAREQRWRDYVNLIVKFAGVILIEAEDEHLRRKAHQLAYYVEKQLKSEITDEQLILNRCRAGNHLVSELIEETGFGSDYVRQILRQLCEQKLVRREKNFYRPR